MKTLNKTASVFLLATTSAMASSAAFAQTYPNPDPGTVYPELPGTPGQPVDITNTNTNTNNNTNNNANTNNNTANGGNATANGGSATANGGNATGGNGYGGNGYGGQGGNGGQGGSSASTAEQQQGQQQGQEQGQTQNATGGNATNQGNSFHNETNVDAPKPMGNVAAVTLIPAGPCGDGWAMNLSIPFFGLGGGKTSQSKFCLSQQGAMALINAGLVGQDGGSFSAGIAALAELHPELASALDTVIANMSKPCALEAAKVSAILLARPSDYTDYCKLSQDYAAAARQVIEQSRTQQGPIEVIVTGGALDRVGSLGKVDDTVKTKEQWTPRKGPAPKAKPMEVIIIENQDKCAGSCPAPAFK